MNKKEQTEKIIKLNKAWKLIRKAIALLKGVFGNDGEVGLYIWRLSKNNDKLQSFVYKKMETDRINAEIDKMEERLKDERS